MDKYVFYVRAVHTIRSDLPLIYQSQARDVMSSTRFTCSPGVVPTSYMAGPKAFSQVCRTLMPKICL